MAQDTIDPAISGISIRKNPDHFSLYSNTLRVDISLNDVSIIFGEIKEEAPGKYFVEDQVTVRLPLVQAKVLMNILSENNKAIEELIGEIKVPAVVKPENYRKNIIPQIREGLRKSLDPVDSGLGK